MGASKNKYDLPRQLFYVLIVRPILMILLGLSVRHLERLRVSPRQIIAANHNSHLDALVLMSLIKFRDIPRVKLVAAKDYFCRTPLRTWISLNLIGVIPIERNPQEGEDVLAPVKAAIEEGYTVVIFPEGTRGEPEKRQPLKYGIAKLAESFPDVTVTPVFMHGLGKSLPRGERLLVPFVCQVNVGEALSWTGERVAFIGALENSFSDLEAELGLKGWD